MSVFRNSVAIDLRFKNMHKDIIIRCLNKRCFRTFLLLSTSDVPKPEPSKPETLNPKPKTGSPKP